MKNILQNLGIVLLLAFAIYMIDITFFAKEKWSINSLLIAIIIGFIGLICFVLSKHIKKPTKNLKKELTGDWS